MTRSVILGTGMAVPERVVTNDDLSSLMDTTDEWISVRTGIRQRHWVREGETGVELACTASEKAIAAAGMRPSRHRRDRAGHLHARSLRARQRRPAAAPDGPRADPGAGRAGAVQRLHLRACDGGCLDSRGHVSPCAGRRPGDPVDGHGCHHARPRDRRHLRRRCRRRRPWRLRGGRSRHSRLRPSLGRRLRREAVGGCTGFDVPPSHQPRADGTGAPVPLQWTARKCSGTRWCACRNRCAASWSVPGNRWKHCRCWCRTRRTCASRRWCRRTLGLRDDQVYNNIMSYGNTTAATIPIALDECVRAGRIANGDLLVFTAFGSGFMWGSVALRW